MQMFAVHRGSQTRMFVEAAEASEVVARQLAANTDVMADLATRLRALDPRIIFTCARGSSDHAATYAKYLFEMRLRIPTVSYAPSISSIYRETLLHMRGQPFILVSQSGQSPDLLLSAEAASKAGALVIAVVNEVRSPLAGLAHVVVPMHAGPETSVAATKSYIASLAAFAHLGAVWSGDLDLENAVAALPATLTTAWGMDWSRAIEPLAVANGLFVLGRGLTLAIAQEAALKFKETCRIHGEAFSLAEVAHGPATLVGPNFPIMVMPPLDRARAGLDTLIRNFAEQGAPLMIAGEAHSGATTLALEPGLHPATGPIAMVQSFYRLANALALARGLDPDHPPMLKKVTETR